MTSTGQPNWSQTTEDTSLKSELVYPSYPRVARCPWYLFTLLNTPGLGLLLQPLPASVSIPGTKEAVTAELRRQRHEPPRLTSSTTEGGFPAPTEPSSDPDELRRHLCERPTAAPKPALSRRDLAPFRDSDSKVTKRRDRRTSCDELAAPATSPADLQQLRRPPFGPPFDVPSIVLVCPRLFLPLP